MLMNHPSQHRDGSSCRERSQLTREMEGSCNALAFSAQDIVRFHRLSGGKSHQSDAPCLDSPGSIVANPQVSGFSPSYDKNLHRGIEDIMNVLRVKCMALPPPPVSDDPVPDDFEIVVVNFSFYGHGAKTVGFNHGYPSSSRPLRSTGRALL